MQRVRGGGACDRARDSSRKKERDTERDGRVPPFIFFVKEEENEREKKREVEIKCHETWEGVGVAERYMYDTNRRIFTTEKYFSLSTARSGLPAWRSSRSPA
jgi:hypothetical protein